MINLKHQFEIEKRFIMLLQIFQYNIHMFYYIYHINKKKYVHYTISNL